MLNLTTQNHFVAAFGAMVSAALFVIASVGPAANNAASMLV